MLRCSKCRSKEIYPVAGGYTGWVYRCKRCGYQGALVLEYDEDESESGEEQP